ncbi:N-acetylglucosamine-6-phosphate deacetylase [Roseibium marinum]|uniref:N-acetylglucosamine-6-phosphate deacetylase n=1 Tax=Roseibium marinum TaxID=281252 RepID=A0A2S3UYG1_9HYPH|nr:N-acetylglucosamine-6-phosphate deacetylase [Roseibium marinum]POF32751.1 N-acetylglucosamine-6-phosphate deacetylase [Roseibium marinum]
MITDGLFDLQVNGFAGVDFNDPSITASALDQALEAMLVCGVTGCLPTLITATPEALAERIRALDAAVAGSRFGPAMVPGYHLEGPFLNAAAGYCGCHPAQAMSDPDANLVATLEAGLTRPILLVTLAPERSGGAQTVRQLLSAGKVVSIGHSAAGFAAVKAAADAGATLSTHLGNGLPAELPKLDNTLLAQLAEPRLKACFIADGIHIPPDAFAALVHLKGTGNTILVSDAVMAAAAPPGRYSFAGMDILADETGKVTRPDGAGLAGSSLRLDQAVRNVIAWKVASPDTAVRMASQHPRTVLAAAPGFAGPAFDPGRIRWNSAMEPTVLRKGAPAGRD